MDHESVVGRVVSWVCTKREREREREREGNFDVVMGIFLAMAG